MHKDVSVPMTLWTAEWHAVMARSEDVAEADQAKNNTGYMLLGLVDVGGPGFSAVAGGDVIPVEGLRRRLTQVAEDARQAQGAEANGGLARWWGRTRRVRRSGTDDYDVAADAFLVDVGDPMRDGRVRRPADGAQLALVALQPVTVASQHLAALGFDPSAIRDRARQHVVQESP